LNKIDLNDQSSLITIPIVVGCKVKILSSFLNQPDKPNRSKSTTAYGCQLLLDLDS